MSDAKPEPAIAEEEQLKLELLRHQVEQAKLKRASDFFSLILTGAAVLAALVVASTLVVVIFKAATSKAVVIEPFDAPTTLAPSGYSGQVLAGQVLDDLTRMHNATRSAATKLPLVRSWTGDIKIEVPETGVTIGEIERLFRRLWGSDIHIHGDLTTDPAGNYWLTVRGDKLPPRTFPATDRPTKDLRLISREAAEYIYGEAQPALYIIYLVTLAETPRDADAIAFAEQNFARSVKTERPFILNQWANALLNLRTAGSSAENRRVEDQAGRLYEAAVDLKPDYWSAHNNIINLLWLRGQEQAAWAAGERMKRAAGGRPGRAAELSYQNFDAITWNLTPWRTAQEEDSKANEGFGTQLSTNAPALALIDLRLHDYGALQRRLIEFVANTEDPTAQPVRALIRALLLTQAGRATEALPEVRAFEAAYAKGEVSSEYPGLVCWIVPAYEAAGLPAEADRVVAANDRFVDCLRFKADMLAKRGDTAAAEQAYAAAAAKAPSLPSAYYSWGVALLGQGRLDAAERKLNTAARLGPGWADPLKALGDVEARRGRWSKALSRYTQALALAPEWPDLKNAKEAAARRAKARKRSWPPTPPRTPSSARSS